MSKRNLVRHHGKIGAHGPGGGQLYASVPMELARDSKLSVYAKAVALVVWSHDKKWHQSAAAVAEAVGICREKAAEALAELQEHGWLVRELHYNPGKKKPAWERWHLQMTNRPFTSDEIRELSTPEGVASADTSAPRVSATPTRTCRPHRHMGVASTDTIEVHSGVHPEVHSSSARTDQDETGSQGLSLAVEGSEAPDDGADHRPVGLVTATDEYDRRMAFVGGPTVDPWGDPMPQPISN